MDLDVAIIGAGPYGLSAAAYLKARGQKVAVFGDPMSFWRDHMPAGMFLRSNWAASHISDPHSKLTLNHFRAESGIQFAQPIPLSNFVAYGEWYQQKAVPDLYRRQVCRLEKSETGFSVRLDSGETLRTSDMPRVRSVNATDYRIGHGPRFRRSNGDRHRCSVGDRA